MKIFLIGLPGSGKTTTGKALAKAMKLPFVDLDVEIEKLERMPVREIFSMKTEEYYRIVESKVVKQWCDQPGDYVISTGGGAPCFFDNMDRINQSGISIFLDVSTREIANRMMKSNLAQRPLLAGAPMDEVKDRIEFLRSHRLPFYSQAAITISADHIRIDSIIEQIKLRKESQE
ncbi:MAG: shikimate kinase [Azospira oryzae]|jgi:shikimate kinase|nr:MAG: shikimate kinase [Azospira oryzae]